MKKFPRFAAVTAAISTGLVATAASAQTAGAYGPQVDGLLADATAYAGVVASIITLGAGLLLYKKYSTKH